MFADKIIYCLNSAAVGDLVASAPVVKWAVDRFHKKADYRLAIFPEFRDLFPFVPQDKILNVYDQFDPSFVVRKLNIDASKEANVIRLTPSRFKLTDYASIGLLSRIVPPTELKYVPLIPVDISHYGIDFRNAVIFLCTYRSPNRAWHGKEIVKAAEHVKNKGFLPVFVGKRAAISIWKANALTTFEYPGFGIDLTDKTSFRELFTIMSQSKVIMGMDSGPLHIAFTTNTPIVAGFTDIAPHLRVPVRNPGVKIKIVQPNLVCQFCQSDWSLDRWEFSKCPLGQADPECVSKMSGEAFSEAFDSLNLTP